MHSGCTTFENIKICIHGERKKPHRMTELSAIASVGLWKQKRKIIIHWRRSAAKRELQRQIVSGPSGWLRLRECDRKGGGLPPSAKAHAQVALGRLKSRQDSKQGAGGDRCALTERAHWHEQPVDVQASEWLQWCKNNKGQEWNELSVAHML